MTKNIFSLRQQPEIFYVLRICTRLLFLIYGLVVETGINAELRDWTSS